MANKLVGQNYSTPDLVAKVTGRAKYAEDFRAEGMLFAKQLLSPLPHARILRVDTSRAIALPGVHLVLTGADVKGMIFGGRNYKDVPVLAWDKVRFIGDRVAAVVADDHPAFVRVIDPRTRTPAPGGSQDQDGDVRRILRSRHLPLLDLHRPARGEVNNRVRERGGSRAEQGHQQRC